MLTEPSNIGAVGSRINQRDRLTLFVQYRLAVSVQPWTAGVLVSVLENRVNGLLRKLSVVVERLWSINRENGFACVVRIINKIKGVVGSERCL